MDLVGTVADGMIVLDGPCSVPIGTKVLVRVEEIRIAPVIATGSSLGKRLLKHAGTVSGLPEDLAQQHDHYLHGTPKR